MLIHHNFAKKVGLASLKRSVDELHIDKLKTVPVIKKDMYNKLVPKVNAISTSKLDKKIDKYIRMINI